MKDKKYRLNALVFRKSLYLQKQNTMQKSLDEARKQKFLDLKKWALTTIQSIHRNYGTQKVWPRGYPGPYIGYRNYLLGCKTVFG